MFDIYIYTNIVFNKLLQYWITLFKLPNSLGLLRDYLMDLFNVATSGVLIECHLNKKWL